jgi:hypothetical protein
VQSFDESESQVSQLSAIAEPAGIPAQSAVGVEKESTSKHPLVGSKSASQAFKVTEAPVNGFTPETTKYQRNH